MSLLPITIVIYSIDAVITLSKSIQYIYNLSKDEEIRRKLVKTRNNIYKKLDKYTNKILPNSKLNVNNENFEDSDIDWIKLEDAKNVYFKEKIE